MSESGSGSDYLESVISAWADKRAMLLFAGSSDARELSRCIQSHDDDLAQQLTAAMATRDGRAALNRYLRLAKSVYADALERRQLEHSISGAADRAAIQQDIQQTWERVGWLHARAETDAELVQPQQEFAARRTAYVQLLAEQLSAVAGEPSATVQSRVERTLDKLRRQAVQHGEQRLLRATTSAHRCHAALPGKTDDPDRLFRLLWTLDEQQRADVAKAFLHDYGKSLPEVLRDAYASRTLKAKNFFRIPALKSALEDQFGIGAGLWKSRPGRTAGGLRLKAWAARWRHSAEVIGKALRHLAPKRPLDWRRYRRRVSRFMQQMSDRASAPHLARIDAALSNDRVAVAVHTLYLMAWRGDSRALQTAQAVLQALSPQQLIEVEERFDQQYGPLFGERSIRTAVSQLLSEHEAAYVCALLDGKLRQAQAARFHHLLHGKLGQRIEALGWLAQLPADDIGDLACGYQELYGATLDRDFLAQYYQGPMQDWAVHQLQGETRLAAAARLECALRRLSGEWPGVVFYDQPEERDLAVIETHDRIYRKSFGAYFRNMAGIERSQLMLTLLTEGSLNLAEQVRHCLIGVGADIDAIKACLAGQNAKQMDKLSQQYAARFSRWSCAPKTVLRAFARGSGRCIAGLSLAEGTLEFRRAIAIPRDLDADLDANLCGYNRFDVRVLRLGRTSNPAILRDRLLQRVAFEQAGAPYSPPARRRQRPAARLLDVCQRSSSTLLASAARQIARGEPEWRLMQREVDAAVRFYDEKILGKTAGRECRTQFAAMVQLAHLRLDLFREMQSRKAERQANLGALATSTVAFFGLLYLHLPYVPLAITVGASSLAGRYLVKTRIKGDGYGEREAVRDGFMALVDGPTLALSQFVKTLRLIQAFGIGRTALSSGVKMALKFTVQTWGRARITNALLKSKESGHARRHLQGREDEILANYRRLLQLEREKALAGKQKTFDRPRAVERVFREVGKRLAAQEPHPSADALASEAGRASEQGRQRQ